jgi:hypothetical protein
MKFAKVSHNGHEHEFEPQHGLPEPLPSDEKLLWQGSPDWRMLARKAFHARGLAVYFTLLVSWQVIVVARGGTAWLDVVKAVAWTTSLSVIAMALVLLLAWLSARTTVYTLTDRRIVMRVGIVLTMTFNLPLKRIAAAGLRLDAGTARATGDIPLELLGNVRIPFLQLWPHARPWKVRQPHPMLRSVPNAAEVARRIGEAWQAATGGALAPAVAPAQPAVAAGSERPSNAGGAMAQPV